MAEIMDVTTEDCDFVFDDSNILFNESEEQDDSNILFNESEEQRCEDFRQEGLELVTGCVCRSQCARKLKTSKNGKVTGCPCKGYRLRCGSSCKCGTKNKPCKNKTQEETVPVPENGEARRDAEITVSESSVENLLESLTPEQLLLVAKKGFKSRRLELQDIITSINNGSVLRPTREEQAHVVPEYCICHNCRIMPTTREQVCCKDRNFCRAKSRVFYNICLESDNLATAIRNMADTYVFTPTYDNRSTRHAAYRQYIMWQHGYLGKGHRKVIPSCCVWEIRKYFPSPNGQYTGYKD